MENTMRISPPAGVVPVVPGPGQESVWDYPRPPRVEPLLEHVRVVVGGITIADSMRAVRVLETAGAPVPYVPPGDVRMDLLGRSPRQTYCEWKGWAAYHTLRLGGRVIPDAAWSYPVPLSGYEVIRDYIAFYPRLVDEAWIGDERATPQPGGYYGGWRTSRIVGPIKGEPGSGGW